MHILGDKKRRNYDPSLVDRINKQVAEGLIEEVKIAKEKKKKQDKAMENFKKASAELSDLADRYWLSGGNSYARIHMKLNGLAPGGNSSETRKAYEKLLEAEKMCERTDVEFLHPSMKTYKRSDERVKDTEKVMLSTINDAINLLRKWGYEFKQ